MRHALVVGGTGMLRGVVRALAGQADVVSVVARRARGLERLTRDVDGRIEPLALDYRDTDGLAAALERVQAAHGPLELAVCWIHGTAPDAPRVVVESLQSPVRVLHVVGSAAADPSGVADDRRVEPPDGVTYRQAILGFVVEDGRSRWLTNDEISNGVLAALESDDDPFIVGTVRPWELRP